jgi:hypothetical protein
MCSWPSRDQRVVHNANSRYSPSNLASAACATGFWVRRFIAAPGARAPLGRKGGAAIGLGSHPLTGIERSNPGRLHHGRMVEGILECTLATRWCSVTLAGARSPRNTPGA